MLTDTETMPPERDGEVACLRAKVERGEIVADVLDELASRAYGMPAGSLRRQIEGELDRHAARRASEEAEPNNPGPATFDALYGETPTL